METAVVERPLLKKWLGFLSQITNGMPASYFGDRSSLVGLANPWGGAMRAWQLPQFIADWISVTGVMRAALVVLCVLNALLVADRLAAGVRYFVERCFIAFAGAMSMLTPGRCSSSEQRGESRQDEHAPTSTSTDLEDFEEQSRIGNVAVRSLQYRRTSDHGHANLGQKQSTLG